MVNINPQQVATTLTQIEEVFQQVLPEHTFHYQLLDQSLADQYQKEARLDILIRLFTILSIFIALIGLIALADILIENRVKEVGIRKVLGASAGQIILLINQQFIRLLLLAIVIAVPAALLLTNRWLDQYVYRVQVDIWVIILICVGSLLLILGTVSIKSLKAALANPVKALRGE
ncbi:MAG: ABC transporter permease [Cyclobacteriaceae bacterium]